jgi:trehalose synthase
MPTSSLLVERVSPHHHVTLDDYGAVATLALAVQELRALAATVVPALEGRTIWMVNSTAAGGGVAEMLPGIVALLRELGLAVEWVVIGSHEEEFFRFTKQIHNMVHGYGEPTVDDRERDLFERVSRDNAAVLRGMLDPNDILVVHDPQPIAVGALLHEELGIPTIWRCHIGLDRRTPATSAAWTFLRPYATTYDQTVFSSPEYIPDYLSGRATVIHPAIDPLSHKSRELSINKLVGILCNARLLTEHSPVRTPPFEEPAQRLQRDGSWAIATEPEDLGLLFRPIVTQVSRWDRLKGWRSLLQGFVRLKETDMDRGRLDERGRRTIETARLVLAGPDPGHVADDPEGREVLDELRRDWLALPESLQSDVALLALPMRSPKQNALMVKRAAALLVGGRAELAARGLRPHRHRGNVEGTAGDGQSGRRHSPADPR